MGKSKVWTFDTEEGCKTKVLEFLRSNRSRKETSIRTGQSEETIEKWASEWRKSGELATAKRTAMSDIHAARLASNGFYRSIRKRFNGMKWNDKINNREFGFNTPAEAVPYFLKDGVPRICVYCGSVPPTGKVWGLDRVDSSLGHVPYNLVPCCGANAHGNQMSCQASKSRYDLRGWLGICIARAFGRPATIEEIESRAQDIENLAKEIAIFGSISLDNNEVQAV